MRLRGDYLAIVTLAFAEIVRIVLVNWDVVTHGEAGLFGFPGVRFFGLPFIPGPRGFDAHFGLKFAGVHKLIFLYYLVLALAILANFVSIRLRRLPLGRAWEALREDEIACRALGLDTANIKLTAFALGAFFAGVAGCLFALRQGFVSPSSFTFTESATILAIVVLGGRGSQVGVAMAAVLIVGASEVLRELTFLKAIFGRGIRPDPIPHAAGRHGHGGDDEFSPTRAGVVARADHRPQGRRGVRMTAPRWIADPLLQVDRLTMRFGGLVAVNNVSFVAGRGDITALIGPNGAGKTTLFNCLTGFYKPTVGRIAFSPRGGLDDGRIEALTATGAKSSRDNGENIYLLERMADHEIAKKARVARTFQNIRLFPGMSALENLIVAQHVALARASGLSVFGLLGLPSWRRAERRRGGAGRKMAGADRTAPSRQRPGRRPALWRPEAARNRPRHVHRPGPALPRRTGGGPQRQ